jgi:hypothetical protein
MRRFLIFSLVALVLPDPSIAGADGFMTGDKLWEYCKTDPPSEFCEGYVTAIVDAMAGTGGTLGGWRACFHAGQTIALTTEVFKLWL